MFGLADRLEVRQRDMFESVAELEGQVDTIVSSPPFISSGRLADTNAHLLKHEPREAFDAGSYGISIHQRLVSEGIALLRAGSGWLVMEFGEGQDRQV
jgi:release factor glutamine methyltransferase